MTLSEIKNVKKDRGFTIVELLIVIVVIGILAAITIVAYNGVQNRAKDTKYQTDAATIVKKAEAINADTGSYPTSSAGFTGDIGALTGVAVSSTAVTSSATKPTNAAAMTAADGSPRTYSATFCGASSGVRVYYPATGGTLASIAAGTCAGY